MLDNSLNEATMKKLIMATCFIFSYNAITQEVAISATGVGVSQIDACQMAKSNLRLQSRGTVTGQGSYSCEKREVDWLCGVNGTANE